MRTGIEPVISSVTGRHVNRYTNAPDGADEGNRTLVSTLARSRSTIELHLQMAQKLGFEPRRRFPDLPVFKTGPFSHLGTSAGCESLVRIIRD